MAGLKKKKKEKSGSPNIVLVVFLVLFIISNITLGVLFYYALDEKDNFRTRTARAEAERKAEKQHAEYFETVWLDARQADGQELGADEKTTLDGNREVLMGEGGRFKDEKTKDAALKMIKEMRNILEVDPNNGKDYKGNFPALLNDARKKAESLEGKANKEAQEHAKTKKLLEELTAKQDELYAKALERIGKEGAAYLVQLKKQTEDFDALTKRVEALNQERIDEGKKIEQMKDEQITALNIKEKKIKFLEADLKEIQGLKAKGMDAGPTLTRGDFAPLLLNIAPGKPLWDQHVGKITRVDLDLRQVVINLGSSQGAKPELTFNVFGPNSSGRAEKSLKGTIEIIKVLDPSSSLCRITSLYDSEGYEIPLGAGTRGQILRETDLPMREGDLLFNLFWGTRVAVAGYVSITGEPSDNPSEQNRQMVDFMALCVRNGMQVDAFVDLRDGHIEGNITGKTRYLILGAELLPPAERKAADPKMGAEPKEGDDKPAPAAPPVNAQRLDAVNKARAQLRSDAKSLGLLMISAENFATVIGYRKARNANSVDVSGFRPLLPYAGPPDAGAMRGPPAAAPMPMPEEKKGADEKMEKN